MAGLLDFKDSMDFMDSMDSGRICDVPACR